VISTVVFHPTETTTNDGWIETGAPLLGPPQPPNRALPAPIFDVGTQYRPNNGSTGYWVIERTVFSDVAGPGFLTIPPGSFPAAGAIYSDDASVVRLNGVQVPFSGSGTGVLPAQSQPVTWLAGANATRGLTLGPGSVEASTVTQDGTGNANVDNLHSGTSVHLHRATVTLNIADAAAGAQTYQGLAITSGGVLTVAGNPGGGGNPLNNVVIETQATVNIQAGGSVARCRFAGEATFNTGAFAHIASVMELQATKTATAANTNKLTSKAFDDWV
jgi:hypothetical protein